MHQNNIPAYPLRLKELVLSSNVLEDLLSLNYNANSNDCGTHETKVFLHARVGLEPDPHAPRKVNL